jgi:hypothetical protein
MASTIFPPEYVCPISQDLMNRAVKVNHNDSIYWFDRPYIEMWRQTDGGDQNPLNMLPGFRELFLEDDIELQRRIDLYKHQHNIISEEPELILLPNDNQYQIMDDYQFAVNIDDNDDDDDDEDDYNDIPALEQFPNMDNEPLPMNQEIRNIVNDLRNMVNNNLQEDQQENFDWHANNFINNHLNNPNIVNNNVLMEGLFNNLMHIAGNHLPEDQIENIGNNINNVMNHYNINNPVHNNNNNNIINNNLINIIDNNNLIIPNHIDNNIDNNINIINPIINNGMNIRRIVEDIVEFINVRNINNDNYQNFIDNFIMDYGIPNIYRHEIVDEVFDILDGVVEVN